MKDISVFLNLSLEPKLSKSLSSFWCWCFRLFRLHETNKDCYVVHMSATRLDTIMDRISSVDQLTHAIDHMRYMFSV